MKIYVAGPMRKIPLHNYPAFDRAVKRGQRLGHEIISPADLDRHANGRDEDWLPDDSEVQAFTMLDMKQAILRDIKALLQCNAVAVLQGWERSTGSKVEVAVAQALPIPVLDAYTFRPLQVSLMAWTHVSESCSSGSCGMTLPQIAQQIADGEQL